MSSIYIQEPPTYGKVLLHTTVGDIDIELWAKETPKACRNFVQLCMEGYYDGTIFHRLVKGFIVQGGDPTGTGFGGDSIYEKTFKDEFHTRLRFVRRGLVAMANSGKNDNGSQFFFTLGACPELQGKHTVFGKVTGNTLYNMLKLEDAMVNQEERPTFPHKILGSKVLANPFTDIIPRIVKKHDKNKEKEAKSAVKEKKNFNLLSFGEEAEEEEAEINEAAKEYRGKGKSSHDLANDPKLSSVPAVSEPSSEEDTDTEKEPVPIKRKTSAPDPNLLETIKKKLKKNDCDKPEPKLPKKSVGSKGANKSDDDDEELLSKTDQYYLDKETKEEEKREEIRAEIRKLKREITGKTKAAVETAGDEEKDKTDDEPVNNMLAEFRGTIKKFKEIKKTQPKKGKGREAQTLELLKKFESKLRAAKEEPLPEETPEALNDDDEVEDDKWLGHVLRFEEQGPVQARDVNLEKGLESYDLSDPRNPINIRRREASQKAMKGKNK